MKDGGVLLSTHFFQVEVWVLWETKIGAGTEILSNFVLLLQSHITETLSLPIARIATHVTGFCKVGHDASPLFLQDANRTEIA